MKRSLLVDIFLRPAIIILAAVFFRMNVKNRKNFPRGSLILAGNHISNWDPPFIAAAVPRAVHFMAKSSLFKTRFLSWFMHKLGAFPINRRSAVNSGALNKAIELVNQGAAVIIFPEGTRSSDGKMLKAKAGVGYIAHATGASVLPFFLEGMDDPISTLLFRSRFRVTFGQQILPEELEVLHKQGGPRKSAEYILDKVKEIKKETSIVKERNVE
ncbi:MAG: 1-acyl-sn-glycerol-3-phosphate acyltransferase [Candidatus Sabulitectum sp.]|nr:1-acyl-sn-glycerol-3-phosphate acyltransferase [Candidatus Sabulitectum sp.]